MIEQINYAHMLARKKERKKTHTHTNLSHSRAIHKCKYTLTGH